MIATSQTRRIVVDLEPGSRPLRGHVQGKPFSGWLQLSAILDAASEQNPSMVVIREGVAADAPAIHAIGAVAFPAAHRGVVPEPAIDAVVAQTYSVPALERCIASCADEPGSHFLVAESAGEVVGFAHFESRELKRFYLRPDRTGEGIGSRLIEALHARLRPGDEYVVMVAAGNASGRAFYDRRGYELTDEVDGIQVYADTMGIRWPDGVPVVPSLLYRRVVEG